MLPERELPIKTLITKMSTQPILISFTPSSNTSPDVVNSYVKPKPPLYFLYMKLTNIFLQARQMVIAATTSEIYPNPSLYIPLSGNPLPGIGKYDHRIPASIGTFPKTITLRGLSREHTKLLLEFYKSAGLWDYSWERSLPTNLALEAAGITEEEYKRLKGMFDWDVTSLTPVEEGVEESAESAADDTSLADLQKALVIGEVEKEEGRAFEVQRMMDVFKRKPLTEHEIAEKHILTGGVPRQVMKLCLRVQGSLNM